MGGGTATELNWGTLPHPSPMMPNSGESAKFQLQLKWKDNFVVQIHLASQFHCFLLAKTAHCVCGFLTQIFNPACAVIQWLFQPWCWGWIFSSHVFSRCDKFSVALLVSKSISRPSWAWSASVRPSAAEGPCLLLSLLPPADLEGKDTRVRCVHMLDSRQGATLGRKSLFSKTTSTITKYPHCRRKFFT